MDNRNSKSNLLALVMVGIGLLVISICIILEMIKIA